MAKNKARYNKFMCRLADDLKDIWKNLKKTGSPEEQEEFVDAVLANKRDQVPEVIVQKAKSILKAKESSEELKLRNECRGENMRN